MRGFDPIARGMKRSDLTPMRVREYRGLLLNSSESISFFVFNTHSKYGDWYRPFYHPHLADAWIFIWSLFGDEFCEPHWENCRTQYPATIRAGY